MKITQIWSGGMRISGLAVLAASLVLLGSQLAWAQAGPSDTLTVDIGPNGLPTGVPQISVLAEGGVERGSLPLPGVLIQPGFINIYEPDGTTLSDVLFSVTGASITLASDANLPTQAELAGLPNLAPGIPFIEDALTGINVGLGQFFAIPGGPPIQPFQIQVFSDGDVRTPEPGSMVLLAIGLLGLLGYGWKRKKLAA